MPPPTSTSLPRLSAPLQIGWTGRHATASPRSSRLRSATFHIGNGTLIHGDFHDVLSALPEKSIDFIYADPPFRTERVRRMTGAQAGRAGYDDRFTPGQYLNLLDDLIRLSRSLLKPTGTLAIHVDHRATHWVRLLLDEHFGPDAFVNDIIWRYGLGNARAERHFARKHDVISVYAAGPAYYFCPQRGEVTAAQRAKYCHRDSHGHFMISYGRKYYLKGGRKLDSVLDIPSLSPTDRSRTGYPTQKPLRLLETLIRAFCPLNAQSIVVDPMCGSGTTLEAAQQAGVRWIGMDRNHNAFRITKRRLQSLLSQPPPPVQPDRARRVDRKRPGDLVPSAL